MGTKLFSDLITFTRASSATRVNSSGLVETVASDQPRFDYDPVTLQPKGLLIEEQRTNLLTYSEQFDNAGWAKGSGATVSANTNAAPDGTTTADTLISGGDSSVFQAPTLVNGATYVFSVWLKAGTRSSISLYCTANSGIPNVSCSLTSSWQRFSLTFTANQAGSVLIGGGGSFTSGTVIAWGAQLEAGAFPTSYIPTTTAAATRAADIATITGSNFSSWYRQDEGTLLGEVISSDGTVCFGVGNTFSDTMYATRGTANNISFRSGGADQAVLSTPFNAASGYANKVVFAYRVNDFAAVSNGGVASTDTSGAVSSNMVRLSLGSSAWDTSGGNSINGHLRRITYYPRRLTDAELQALTK